MGKSIRIEQVRVIDPTYDRDEVTNVTLDVTLNQGQMVAATDAAAEVIDGRGLVLGPGLVDLYSTCGEPGFEERETIASLTAAAIAGGFSRVMVLPGTQPALDNPASLLWFRQQGSGVLRPWAALTQGGEKLTELGEIAQQGIAVGFTDGKAIANLSLLRRLLEYMQPLKMSIALWPNDGGLAGAGLAREGMLALRYGLPGIPSFVETAPLAAILELVREIGTPVHLMRVSTARSVALIQAAKAEGLPITASTTWLHLLYETQDLANYSPNLRLNPPLGNSSDRMALIEAVKTGVIDAIAIDHTAYTYEEKTVAFGEAPVGSIGLELALPMLWQGLVASGKLSALELWRSLSTSPAQCLGQTAVSLTPGATELTLFDPQATWQVDRLQSLSQNSHLWGRSIQGRVLPWE
jgi:dihydroorotase